MKVKRWFKLWLAPWMVLFQVTNIYAAESKIDWKAIEVEAVSHLSRYIQIDTTNPPGNEIKAAQFLAGVLEREGIDARIIESAPGRANLYARLKGDGSKKAVAMMHHMDVVPAVAQQWQEAPFSGTVKEGVVWGRGARDNKGPGIMELMTLLTLKRQSVALKGDVIFIGTADEEAGGNLGAGYLLDKHPELFKDVSVVLNEGGGIRVDENGRARMYSVGIAEKVPLWLKLTAIGTPGHGASPGSNQAVVKLIAALHRISNYQSPIKVVPEVQKFYADSAVSAPADRRAHYGDLSKALKDPAFASEFTKDRSNNARVRNTISITGIKGSEKINVIPAAATAELDVRLLPGEEPKRFIAELRRVIGDDSIKIEIFLSRAAAISPANPEAIKVIEEFARAHDPGTPVIFPLGSGFTDCHFFRAKGIPCLGFIPQRSAPSEEGMTHGINERVSVERLVSGIRAMYEIVRKLAAE
ncbi:MAG TPA: M20/M25/M40 family metallo-hydrolase [Candidatus Binatia bacterium]|nr:M20/M25/M40 family metallo-hydrolase [Candidatus Binatia bacterium]